MNFSIYTEALNNPNQNSPLMALTLQKIIEKYPYLQSARVLHLKQLFDADSRLYNFQLKQTAAYTTDRAVLFDFITNENFVSLQNKLFQSKTDFLKNITVNQIEVVPFQSNTTSTLENSIRTSIELASENSNTNAPLQIGKPLRFSAAEKHSFQEWLQLSRLQPIVREENQVKSKTNHDDLIDKFIASNPKIPALDKSDFIPTKPTSIEENGYLMTETLARVYVEQKKYLKAVQAYEILILKYPEKSSYFAHQISDIKKIQQNNIF